MNNDEEYFPIVIEILTPSTSEFIGKHIICGALSDIPQGVGFQIIKTRVKI